jgi:excisionase family DNA binding protein
MEQLLNVSEVATLLKVHHKKVQRLARTGVIPSIKIGAVYRFSPAALEAWLSAFSQPPKPRNPPPLP